jgi:hypothetical protein
MKPTSDSRNKDSNEARIVFCPRCTNRPMAIKSVTPATLHAMGVARYFCLECGHETIKPLPIQSESSQTINVKYFWDQRWGDNDSHNPKISGPK